MFNFLFFRRANQGEIQEKYLEAVDDFKTLEKSILQEKESLKVRQVFSYSTLITVCTSIVHVHVLIYRHLLVMNSYKN